MTTTTDPSTNGHDPAALQTTPGSAGSDRQRGPDGGQGPDRTLAPLRARPVNVNVLWGYGPLVVGALLFILMVILAPTVAPERIVERPAGGTTTTQVTIATTTTAPAATTTVAPAAEGSAP